MSTTVTSLPPSQVAPSQGIWKLLGAIVITVAMVVAAPYAAARAGLMAALASQAWLILLVAASGLVIKQFIGDTVGNEFVFHKFGYDNCVMTFGAALSSFALQVAAPIDMFPGMNSVAGFKSLPEFSSNVVNNRIVQLMLLLLLTLVCTLLTGRISSYVRQPGGRAIDLLSLLSAIIGTLLLGLYVLTLITKG